MTTSRFTIRIGREEAHLPTTVLALIAGAAGGFGARAIGLPLPMLLGSLIVLATLALAGIRPTGRVLGLPMAVRQGFIPVIGVSIGTAVTPALVTEIPRWWPTLAALILYIPVAHALGYTITRRIGGLDRPTAFYGTMPGGFIEALTMGDQEGADAAYLTILQFLRLILCIVLIPVGFTLITGEAVGSATGAVIGGAGTLTAADWGILFVAGVVGAIIGSRLGFPAGLMTGPFLVSGIVHYTGLVHAGPPGWLIDLTQLVIGTNLGARFAGRSPRILLSCLAMAGANVGAILVLAAGISATLHGVVGERWEAVFLAFAPGGLAEMSLVALSLEISVIFVTAHHIVRIVLAVVVARLMARRVLHEWG